MRRYRKGQIYKPPSAAESAAIADVAEAYRRAPVRPQDYRPTGQIVEVLTPAGGIAARAGATIYWELCKRCIHTDVGDEKTRVDTDDQVIVHNLSSDAIAGDSYVRTGLTDTGVRYVLVGTLGGSVTPVFTASTTFSGTGNFDDVSIKLCNSSIGEYSVGDHGISFDTDHWGTSLPGIYYIEASVGYQPPNPAMGPLCDPAITNPSAALCRMLSVDIETSGSPVYGEFQDRAMFYNFIEHGLWTVGYAITQTLNPYGVVNMSSGGTVQLKIWAETVPSNLAIAWPVASAHITFMRLNDEWSA